MATDAGSATDADSQRPFEDTAALMPGLTEELKAAGLDASRVDEFMELLKQCNVHTRGALRLFAPQLPPLVDTMYDMETPLGPLQAKGFLASLRVSLTDARTSTPCSAHFSFQRRAQFISLRRRLWTVYRLRRRKAHRYREALAKARRGRRRRQGRRPLLMRPPFELYYKM